MVVVHAGSLDVRPQPLEVDDQQDAEDAYSGEDKEDKHHHIHRISAPECHLPDLPVTTQITNRLPHSLPLPHPNKLGNARPYSKGLLTNNTDTSSQSFSPPVHLTRAVVMQEVKNGRALGSGEDEPNIT